MMPPTTGANSLAQMILFRRQGKQPAFKNTVLANTGPTSATDSIKLVHPEKKPLQRRFGQACCFRDEANFLCRGKSRKKTTSRPLQKVTVVTFADNRTGGGQTFETETLTRDTDP